MIHINISELFGGNYYTLFYISAICTGVAVAGIAAVKTKFGIREFAVITSAGILALIMGGKLLSFDNQQWSLLFREFHLPAENGKATLGSLAGLMIGLWAAGRILGKNESILNLFAMSVPLGLAVQAFGCLSAGCGHGAITNLPWGITYGPDTRIYFEQLNQGLISPDAAATLAVHPSQLYTVIACLFIAITIWKTRYFWHSASGNFIFSIILFLAYRVAEEISSYSVPTKEWMGMSTLFWKVLALLLFSGILAYREWKAITKGQPESPLGGPTQHQRLKVFFIALFILALSINLGNWFSPDERALTLIIIFPLCGMVFLENVIKTMVSFRFAKAGLMATVAIMLMGQKADVPPGTPKSYTSFNLTSAFGNYDMDHLFNKDLYHDCNGDPYLSGEDVGYDHTYSAGGIGISRKTYYTQWQSTLASLNVFVGRQESTPINTSSTVNNYPHFKSTLWSINPTFQFDTRGIGLGIGASFGNVGTDRKYNLHNLEDFTPKGDGRTLVLATRLRFFSERYFFIEMLGGYDAGAIGEYNGQALVGSRFNTNKYMLKLGYAITGHSDPSFIFKGEMRLAPNLFLSPQFIIFKKNDTYIQYEGGGYRAVIGLEYRLQDKDKANLKK